MTLKEFCNAHGGYNGHRFDLSKDGSSLGFCSIKTVDGQCFLSFAKTQFSSDEVDSQAKVMDIVKTSELDVLETTTQEGKPCFVIVRHSDLYEGFDF